jgi:hypothetical protein
LPQLAERRGLTNRIRDETESRGSVRQPMSQRDPVFALHEYVEIFRFTAKLGANYVPIWMTIYNDALQVQEITSCAQAYLREQLVISWVYLNAFRQ